MDGMELDRTNVLQQEVTIWEYERGLLYREGRFEKLLEPGRYLFWRWEKVRVVVVSLRQVSEAITGQAMLTSDKVEVRLSLVAQYQVHDPLKAVQQVDDYSERLYQDIQLALRDLVTGYDIDGLLAARGELGEALHAAVAPGAEGYGLALIRVGVRDIVLPGSVKTVFMREVEADREGRAELVKARHEVAAARARANTARLLSQNPNIARMQELDVLVKLAGRNGSVVLLPNIADLLVPRAVDSTTAIDAGSDEASAD